jgi:hypothetical protein
MVVEGAVKKPLNVYQLYPFPVVIQLNKHKFEYPILVLMFHEQMLRQAVLRSYLSLDRQDGFHGLL